MKNNTLAIIGAFILLIVLAAIFTKCENKSEPLPSLEELAADTIVDTPLVEVKQDTFLIQD
jgi:hypothetical protein